MSEERYVIKKVLNNNVVFAKNNVGQDVVLTGLGLGFQRKKQDLVDNSRIEHIFTLEAPKTSGKLAALLEQIPIEYFYISDKIKKLAERRLKKSLSQNIYVTLCDHIFYSVHRLSQGLVFENQMMWEISRFYQEEYKVACDAIKIINNELKINLPESEASFIALHIINAEIHGDQIQAVVEMTKLIKGILNIVQYEFHMEFDENSISFTRFVLHLKFFSQRLITHEKSMGEAGFLFDQIKENMPDAFRCTKKIDEYIKSIYSYSISKNESVYLTLHIQRLLTNNKK